MSPNATEGTPGRLWPLSIALAAGLLSFATGLGYGPVSYDALARFPTGGRALGLGLHLLVTVAVYELWRRRSGRADEAFWAATLFAVLPATSEGVLAAAGRGPQIASLLVILGVRIHAAPGRLAPLWIAILQGLALQLHATGVALVPLALLYDSLLLRRPLRDSLVGVGPAIAVVVAALITQAAPGDPGEAWAAIPFVAEGLGRALVPHTQTVAWVPERPSPALAAGLALGALVVFVGVVVLRRKRPDAPAASLFGLGWWGLATLPMAPIALTGQAVPEAGLYLALVGPCLWLGRAAAGFRRWFTHIGRGRLAAGLLVAVVFLLSARSALRTQDWRDDFLLHLSAVEDEPYNPEALYRYGTHLAMQGERLSSARALARAYEVSPDRVDVANNFAVTLMYRGEWALSETLLRSALARAPNHPTVGRNLERVVARQTFGASLLPP